jgi:hypothetical protein
MVRAMHISGPSKGPRRVVPHGKLSRCRTSRLCDLNQEASFPVPALVSRRRLFPGLSAPVPVSIPAVLHCIPWCMLQPAFGVLPPGSGEPVLCRLLKLSAPLPDSLTRTFYTNLVACECTGVHVFPAPVLMVQEWTNIDRVAITRLTHERQPTYKSVSKQIVTAQEILCRCGPQTAGSIRSPKRARTCSSESSGMVVDRGPRAVSRHNFLRLISKWAAS